VNPDPLYVPDEEPVVYVLDDPWTFYPEPRRSWLSRLIAAIRRRFA
jgi:hypothetical protein